MTTRAKYRQTLAVLEPSSATAPVTGAGIGGVVAQHWHHAAPATWNRHLATVRSLARYCERTELLDIKGEIALDRRAEKHDQTRSIALASLERLWERRDTRVARAHAVAAAVRDRGTRRIGGRQVGAGAVEPAPEPGTRSCDG